MSIWRRSFYYCLVVSGLLCVQICALSYTTKAQPQVEAVKSALSVSPAIIEPSLTPGKETSFTLIVRNITNSPLPITSFVRGFTVKSTELEKTDHVRLDASQWFTIQNPDFILQPNQEHTVTGSIKPPVDAEPGGHYATVFFQPLVSQEETVPSMARVSARVGVLSFLTVKGKVVESASLTGKLETQDVIHSGPMDMKFRITNTGNVHIIPKGVITIYDWRGVSVVTIDVPTGIILPDATKEYSIPWTAPVAIGKYRAELSLEYGKSNVKLEKSSISFWVMPVAEMIVGSICALLISLFVFKTHSRWAKAWHALKSNAK